MISFRHNLVTHSSKLVIALLWLSFAKAAIALPSDFLDLCGGKYEGPDAALATFEAAGWQLATPEQSSQFARADFDADIATALADGSFGDLVKQSVDVRLVEFDAKQGMLHLAARRNFEGPFATQEESATKTSILLRLHKRDGAQEEFAELRFPKVYEKEKPLVCTWLSSDHPTGLTFTKSLFPNAEIEANQILYYRVNFKSRGDFRLVGSVIVIDAAALTAPLGTELRASIRLKIENADFRIVPSP